MVMVINFRDEELELKFTFNSFKYMRDFDMGAIQTIEAKPFELIPLMESLLLGAMNNNPKKKFSILDVERFLEEYIEDGSVTELLNGLMELLQESSFFKSLQRETEPIVEME